VGVALFPFCLPPLCCVSLHSCAHSTLLFDYLSLKSIEFTRVSILFGLRSFHKTCAWVLLNIKLNLRLVRLKEEKMLMEICDVVRFGTEGAVLNGYPFQRPKEDRLVCTIRLGDHFPREGN
jgi:hypothetical protein